MRASVSIGFLVFQQWGTVGGGSRVQHGGLGQDEAELVLVAEQRPRGLQDVQPQLLAAQQVEVHLVCWRETWGLVRSGLNGPIARPGPHISLM